MKTGALNNHFVPCAMKKEQREQGHARPAIVSAISLFVLGSIAFCSFSKELKRQVREEQQGACGDCGGKPKKLQIHHIVPQSMGGSDERENAVGLCCSCHAKWDELAREGVIYPGVPIKSATEKQKKEKTDGKQ